MERRAFLARSGLIGVGLVAGAAAVSPLRGVSAPGADDTGHGDLVFATSLAGTPVSRLQVLQWEARRQRIVAERLRHNYPAALVGELDALLLRPALSTSHVVSDRERLADAKMRLGDDAIRRLVAADVHASTPVGGLAATTRHWKASVTEIKTNRGTAEGFAAWFTAARDRDDERAMLLACPDHYVIRTQRPRVQEVIEVTGGAVLASQFFIHYGDEDGVPIKADDKFPVQLVGVARNVHGEQIGAVRHQFANDPHGKGFAGRFAVAFPAALPPWMISEHRWHLACEMANWISAYIADTNH